MTVRIIAMRDAARAMIESHMRGTAVIYTYSRTSDGIGGGTASYTASGTVACSVGVISMRARGGSDEGVHQGLLQDVQYWFVSVPYSATVTSNDRLMVGSATYEVLDTNEAEQDRLYIGCKCAVVT